MTHSIAKMADTLVDDPGSLGVLSGVGMSLEKHTYAVFSTEPGPVQPPDDAAVQSTVDAAGAHSVVELHEGSATVAAYSVVHGHEGPQYGVAVLDLPEAGTRAYARILAPDLMADAERTELIGRTVAVTNDGRSNTAVW
jgi:acetyl-CoA C-acetyltransferase